MKTARASPKDDTYEQEGQPAQSSQGQGSADQSLPPVPQSYPSPLGHTSTSWNLSHDMDNNSGVDGASFSSACYYQDQQSTMAGPQDGQVGLNASSSATTASSNVASANGCHDYCGYMPIPNSGDHYPYGSTSYQGYNYGYQQQGNHSFSQQVGAYQNSGAPYQPVNSFHNASSYTGSTSYPSTVTYYNTGVYQTTGGYQSTSYSGHSGSWSENNYGNYAVYPNYSDYTPSDSNGPVSSALASVNQFQYQQDYTRWADYYRQTGSDVSCAPGTESTVSGNTGTGTSLDYPVSGLCSGFSVANNQPPPPGTQPSWKSNVDSYCEVPSSQVNSVGATESGGISWNAATADGYRNDQYNQPQQVLHQPYFQQPLDSQPVRYHQTPLQQQTLISQGETPQGPPTHQSSHSFQSPAQSVSSVDTSQRRMGKLQIPTNPRIASNLAFGMPNMVKGNTSETTQPKKPAYISVNVPSSHAKVSSDDVADAMLKPGMFPSSLRAYVERALARCKVDAQKVVCQDIMKEMITKASGDGSLFTRDWDSEPLFPLPSTTSGAIRNENLQSCRTVGSVAKSERSPGRRAKSRWEPVADVKPDEQQCMPTSRDLSKEGIWDRLKERGNVASLSKWDNKEGIWNKAKQSQQQQHFFQNKKFKRPGKKARKGDSSNAVESGESTSGSDKETGQEGSYSGPLGLATTPEERKRRQSRSKRFDKGNEADKRFRTKAIGAVNSSTRRASALLLAKSYEDGSGRAVEDIDWDSLTVKGTCQDIEKRYLRLTSAPDPSTVRPEEVLEKALDMVQSSPKNYLYKCEQLKSIRQDLTVQRIRNELTVKVYETHARLALEAGDLPEYNQCQSQLKGLYGEGIKGCLYEFAAYNLLCIIQHSSNNRDLLSSMARLSKEAKKDEAVKHALAVRAAVASGNYTSFFRLYRAAPNLNTCLMDLYVEKMRFEAVRCISRSYRPTVPIAFIAQTLGFIGGTAAEGSNEKEPDGLEECEEWLRSHGAKLSTDKMGELELDAKDTASRLFMPEPEDAVAHGDANLAVNDFLART